jgi:hypothetical protein
MKLRKTTAAIAVAVALMVSSIAVYADTITEKPTHDGQTFTCQLTCSWSITGNDNGTATTTWALKSGHQSGSAIYQCQSATDSYHLCDEQIRDTNSTASGSVSGVWKYKSIHRIYHLVSGEPVAQTNCMLEDW